jgi:hypothetical protein
LVGTAFSHYYYKDEMAQGPFLFLEIIHKGGFVIGPF